MVSKRKAIFITLAVIALGALLIWLGPGFYNDYKSWQFTKQMNQAAEELDKAGKEEYQAMMADTYGGQTPQETLKLYIVAVEKGDYELASRYFILDKQKMEAKSFIGTTSENLDKYIKVLKSLKDVGYSEDAEHFSMKADLSGPDFYAEFFISPNGTWKIVNI